MSFASSSAAVNVNGPPSSLYGPAGLSFTASGASLISVTVIVNVRLVDAAGVPSSVTVTVIVTVPNALATGAYARLPVASGEV